MKYGVQMKTDTEILSIHMLKKTVRLVGTQSLICMLGTGMLDIEKVALKGIFGFGIPSLLTIKKAGKKNENSCQV